MTADDRGLAALAERLWLALGWPTRAYPEYRLPDGLRTGDGDNDAWAELAGTVLGPSGRFSPDGGLDVERLARAMSAMWEREWKVKPPRKTVETFATTAKAIAAEYVRLATPKEEQG